MANLRDHTLVLNRSWMPITVTSVVRALCKVYEGSARVIHPDHYTMHDFSSWAAQALVEGAQCIRTPAMVIMVPEVIVLAHYNKVPKRQVSFSRRNLFRRDHHTCQYCGKRPGGSELTIDHILPRSRGGLSSWTNCVLACIDCNTRKADRTPREAGMRLRHRPLKPAWNPSLELARVKRKPSWDQFVSHMYWNVELQP